MMIAALCFDLSLFLPTNATATEIIRMYPSTRENICCAPKMKELAEWFILLLEQWRRSHVHMGERRMPARRLDVESEPVQKLYATAQITCAHG